MTRQVPDYHALEQTPDALPTESNHPSRCKNLVSYYHAYAPKIGDFSTNYFNYLKIQETLIFLLIWACGEENYWAFKIVSIIFAAYLAVNSGLNDLLLYIPSAQRLKLEEALRALAKQFSSHFADARNDSTDQSIPLSINLLRHNAPAKSTNVGRYVGYIIMYSAFAILSANGAVGVLTVFSQSITAKILGSILAILGTELGILYSHMVFYPRIQEFTWLVARCRNDFLGRLRIIWGNRVAGLQVIKLFSILSLYYTSMGIFYLYSLAERLAYAFSFPINSRQLNIAMIIAGILVFLTNIVLRLMSTVKKYFSAQPYSPTQRKWNYFLELSISMAGLTFCGRRFNSHPGMALAGALIGVISLVIGIKAIALCPVGQSSDQTTKIASWLNAHSRFIKSTFLPFAAIRKVAEMLKTHSDFDLGFDTIDILLWTIIIGIPIGINSSSMYEKQLGESVEFYKPMFGRICYFFRSNDDQPELPPQPPIAISLSPEPV